MTSEIDLKDTYEYQVCRNSYAINDILVGTLFAGPVGLSSPPDQFLHESDLPGVALFFLINPYILSLQLSLFHGSVSFNSLDAHY